MQNLRFIRIVHNYVVSVARCLIFTLLVCAMLWPVASNTASDWPKDTLPHIEAASAGIVKLSFTAPQDADKPHIMAASYYSLQDNFQASLTLNNKAPIQLEVQATLFSLAGKRLDVPITTP
jgi:hypothetical protein